MTVTKDPDSPPAADDLNDAERRLLEAAPTGVLVDLRTGDPDVDNPAIAANWDADRNVRADFLADLLTGDRVPDRGRPRSVKLRGARITGALGLEARKLLCPLLLHDCYFVEPINLDETKAITIRLPGCHTPGLDANQLRTSGNVDFNEGFTARGIVGLVGARIGGSLALNAASLINHDGPALAADRLNAEQTMFCCGGFTAHGEIRLLGAHIGGQLVLNGANLTNQYGPALSADELTVDQSVACCEGFTAHGEIRLLGAHIGGQLDLSGANLTNQNGRALYGDGLTVSQNMFCRVGFTAHGEIRLLGAHIGGQLSFMDAALTNNDGLALNADSLTVDQDMFCANGFTAHGEVSLRNAKVGVFLDDQADWPDVLRLRGFSYDRLGDQNVSVRARLEWLSRDDGPFTPQIYDQLGDAYRRAGDEGAARKISVAKQWRRRKQYNPLSWLWWATVGYGYRTWQAFIWAAVLTLAGSLVFSGAYPAHMAAVNAHPPRFQPVIYALDVLLPIGGLGQKSAWQATGAYLDWYWAFAIAGWVLAIAVVAGLTGILKRD